MKNRLIKAICAVMAAIVLLNVVGCIMGNGTRGKPIGDFYVIFNEEEGTCKINDLTEQGAAKDVLVFPKEIEGYSVIGFDVIDGGCTNDGHHIREPRANKVFFESFYLSGDSFIFSYHYINNVILLYYDSILDYIVFVGYPYNCTYYLKSNIEISFNKKYYKIFHANVSYYYNYEREDGEEYYWIDDYDGDELISYIPEDPERDGYTFAGWYKEPECINEWKFEVDKVPLKEYDGEGKYLYKETCLYAKWVENN